MCLCVVMLLLCWARGTSCVCLCGLTAFAFGSVRFVSFGSFVSVRSFRFVRFVRFGSFCLFGLFVLESGVRARARAAAALLPAGPLPG